MNTAMTEKVTALDAYDLATYALEHGKWLGALMRSITLDAKHNDGRNVAVLAGLGQHLGEDLIDYMGSEAERIKRVEGLQ